MQFAFRGLMAPVFTPFLNKIVNLEVIPKYAAHLKRNEVFGVLANGTTGEGTSLNLAERIKITDTWHKACKEQRQTLMVQIAGAPFPDVIDMARHAEQLKLDAVLCLPELYFKPKTVGHLVDYLLEISIHCPSIPLFYYHIPRFTNVNLNMPQLIDQAKKRIPNFCGLKYSDGDLEQAVACLTKDVQIFLGANTILNAAWTAGFDSAILTSLNICPEHALAIVKGQPIEARAAQKALNESIKSILKTGDWVPDMKQAFNEQFPELSVGGVRKPLLG